MRDRCVLAAIVLVGLGAATAGAPALDDAEHDVKLPDIGGTWVRPGAAQWDP